MSTTVQLVSEHYTFVIQKTDRKIGEDTISNYFSLGNQVDPCLSCIVYTKAAQKYLGDDILYTANLMNVETLKECVMNDVSDEVFEKYSMTVALLHTFIPYIKTNYPYVKQLKLNDSSYIPCGKNDTLDLISYYIALYGTSWYEAKFNAIPKKDINLYRSQVSTYISKEFKESISYDVFYGKYIVLASQPIVTELVKYKELYERSDTFPAFFRSINANIQRNNKCSFFKTWLEQFISDTIRIPREWYIPIIHGVGGGHNVKVRKMRGKTRSKANLRPRR